jgi:hypothetical protein
MASVAHGLVPRIQTATKRSPVSRTAPAAAPAADEARLTQRAAAGDGDAFAELYSPDEQRVFNPLLIPCPPSRPQPPRPAPPPRQP